MKRLGSRGALILLAIIVLVAIFFRTFRLSELPRGMTGDEATHGLAALAIARGEEYPIFLLGMGGTLPMYTYWIALLFRLFGASIQMARAGTALVGIATLPLFYLLVRELFPSTGNGHTWSVIAPLATYFLATSYWHVVYSRLAIEPILVPLFGILIMYCLLRAWKSRRRVFFLLGGLFLGLAFYTYPAANFLPLLVFALLGYYTWHDRQFLSTHWINALLLFAICFAIVTPLALYAVGHFDIFMSRARGVSVLNPELTERSPIMALALSIAKTAAMFSLRGDLSPVYNPARRPVLDPLASIWFILGFLVTIRKWREPSYFLPLIWLVIMCLPAAVTAQDIPHFSRTIGALPSTCVLPAIGISFTWEWIKARIAPRRLFVTIISLLFSLSVLFTTATTYRDYFVAWDEREDLRQGYDGAYTAAAAVMNQTHVPESIWILPLTAFVPSGYGADHFDFLYHGDTPYYTVSLDETTAPDEISSICQGKRKALVVDWKGYVLEEAYNAMAADPKGLIPFLFQKYGREVNRKDYEAFDIVAYELPESPAFSIIEGFEPLSVNFGDGLMLLGAAFGGSSLQNTGTALEVERRELPSGKSGWVVLRWQALRAPSRNYKVAVYLQDAGGHKAGQVDKLLLSNYLHPTRHWKAGQEEIDYYTLSSWDGTAPGRYKIGVTVYDAENLEAVGIIGGGQTYQLGVMDIVRPLVAAEVQPEVRIGKKAGEVAPGIRLLGYDLPRRELNPGDTLSVALYWQALEDVSRNYLLAVQLTNEQGQVWAEGLDSPVYGTYPTIEWAKGETLKEWHNLSLPADMAQGSYELSLAVSENDRLLHKVSLERIDVRGQPHQFVMPEIQHHLEARLGEGVRFLGYDLSRDEVRAGETLQLTLYWQALEEMELSYTVFTHLLDAEERIWGQRDSIPGGGTLPTTSWIEGEVIGDEYQIVVDDGASGGQYVIEVGMYNAQNGERLPVYDDQGNSMGSRIVLGEVEVMGRE